MTALVYLMLATSAALAAWALVVMVSLMVGKVVFTRSSGLSLGMAGAWAWVLASVAFQVNWPVDPTLSEHQAVENARFVFNAGMLSVSGFVIASLIGWTSAWVAKRRLARQHPSSQQNEDG
jgi:hypothetical protein